MAGFRIYVSDKEYDGAGWGPADTPSLEGPGITCEGKLADGTRLSNEEVVKRFGRPMGSAPPPLTIDQWYKLIDSEENDPILTPATAPARRDSQFELFRGMKYSLLGAFMKPEDRARIPVATVMEGGGDPTTEYMINFLSREFGPVYVFRAKLPTFPDTFAGRKTMPEGQVAYWSVVTVASAPSGELWDGVFDMQVPLDKDGYYTIVVSRREDRPKNATREDGAAWIDWGPGEGLDDPRNRKDWGMLIMRFMVPQKDWEHSPAKVPKPGMEAEIMGSYYPQGYYTTKKEFEADGPRKIGCAAIPAENPSQPELETIDHAMNTASNERSNDQPTSSPMKSVTIDNTRDLPFGKILVAKETGVEVYNTTGLNDCPADLWNKMDLPQLAKQFGARAVQQNGPHYWTMDSQTVSMGKTATFGGIEARLVAILNPAIVQKSVKGMEPYTVFSPKKTQRMVYAKGRPVFELIDPDGHIYVLQAHDEQFHIEALPSLGEKLKHLPKDWKYRTRTLTEDLVLDLGPDKTIYAIGDEFHQYYTRIPESK